MAGIFPRGGNVPGDANSGTSLTLTPADGCEALYYPEDCAKRVDPTSLNAWISEVVSIINACNTLVYDCGRKDNLLLALQCLFGLPACPGAGCYRLVCNSGVLSWVACDTSSTTTIGKLILDHTGADQTFTIPNANTLRVSAVGGASGYFTLSFGHPQRWKTVAGYVRGEIPLDGSVSVNGVALVPGVALRVMVGGGASAQNCSTESAGVAVSAPYGFGSGGYGNAGGNCATVSGGSGLSGIFVGGGTIVDTDAANAIMIAGGTGGAGELPTYPNTLQWGGWPGNVSEEGGQTTMQGYQWPAGNSGTGEAWGGGGGGYAGGAAWRPVTGDSRSGAGKGGSNFVASGLANVVNQGGSPVGSGSLPPSLAANPDFAGFGVATPGPARATNPGQHGRVVFEWY